MFLFIMSFIFMLVCISFGADFLVPCFFMTSVLSYHKDRLNY